MNHKYYVKSTILLSIIGVFLVLTIGLLVYVKIFNKTSDNKKPIVKTSVLDKMDKYGVRYQYDESLAITTSVAHFIYKGTEGNFKEKYGVAENQKYKKEITAIGLSITKKF